VSNGNTYFLHDNKPDPSPREQQDRVRGKRLIAGGWALRVAGTALGLWSWFRFKDIAKEWSAAHATWWLGLLGCVLVLGAGAFAFGLGRRLVLTGKQHTATIIEPSDPVATTGHVLYLRSFSDDRLRGTLPTEWQGGGTSVESAFLVSGRTQEEILARRFRRFGPLVAIGCPKALPLPGAARAYVTDSEWQRTVTGLIEGAHMVLLSAGVTAGTVWEFTEVLRILPPERLVLLVYCDPAAYNDFRKRVAEEYVRRSTGEPGPWPPLPELPAYPPPVRPRRPRWEVILNGGRKRLRWDFDLKGVVAFGPDWQPEFIRFDPTAVRLVTIVTLHRLVKRKLQPVMDQLAALPPRT
jgi:hypothetical protein